MKKLVLFNSILLFCLFCLSIKTPAQSSFAVVKPNGSTTITASFQSALDASTAGDIIYLPSGSLNLSGVIVNKPVNIIGAGYCPDSSNGTVTIISSDITISSDASGGSLTGVFVMGDFKIGTSDTNNGLQNYNFLRVWFSSRTHNFYLSYNDGDNKNAKNLTFTECFFDQWWTKLNVVKFLLFDKCIFFWDRIHYVDGDVTFKNCIFTHNDPSWTTMNYVKGALFQNCIFAMANTGLSASYPNTFINNLFLTPMTSAGFPGQIMTNNIIGFDSSKVFISGAPPNWPMPGANCIKNAFYLTTQAKAAITGTDGKEVGIYGGSNPFKDGGLPPIPAIRQAKVSSKSNAKGKVDIEFKVQAQTK
jgi:hypothetical protein